jgi:hypothetical protein
MGQAKTRRNSSPIVYHHTSVLRTNLIWMSGTIDVEGRSKGAVHPQLGEVSTNGALRRRMTDFPPLVWFTSSMERPKCLVSSEVVFADDRGNVKARVSVDEAVSRGLSMTPVSLGFRAADIPVRPWPEHPGYRTAEGGELNETAADYGDDPKEWFVAEEPIDVMKIIEFRSEVSNGRLRRMVRQDWYLPDIKRMVTLCRTTPGVHIPPSWVGEHNIEAYLKFLREKPGIALPKSGS